MPNYVANVVTIDASLSNTTLEEILNFIENQTSESEDAKTFDFNKIIPVPEEIANVTNDCRDAEYALLYIYYMRANIDYLKTKSIRIFTDDELHQFYDNTKKVMFFNSTYDVHEDKFVQIDYNNIDYEDLKNYLWIDSEEKLYEALIRAVKVIDCIIKYGFSNWYDFCVAKWGTKWNAHEVIRMEEDTIGFYTAWATPEPIIKELSKKFPDVYFIVKFADEGTIDFNSGEYTYFNGEVESERFLSSSNPSDVILYYNIFDFDLYRDESDGILSDELDMYYRRGEYAENVKEVSETFLSDESVQKEVLEESEKDGTTNIIVNVDPE